MKRLVFIAVLLVPLALGLFLGKTSPYGETPVAPLSSQPTATSSQIQNHPGSTLDLRNAFATGDARALRDGLLAQGLSPRTARAAVQGMMAERLEAEIRAEEKAFRQTEAGKKWWLDPSPEDPEGRAHSEKLSRLRADMDAALGGLFPALNEAEGQQASAQSAVLDSSAYSFLSPERRQLLAKIEQDYEEMIRATEILASSFELPSDRHKIEFLRVEKERDIETALTPDERKKLELRTSPIAERLRSLATDLNVSESEYLQLYALEKARDARLENETSTDPEREELNHQKNIAAIIGTERFRTYNKKMDDDYVGLKNAAERFNLSPATVDSVYNQRYDIATQSRRIASNTSLSTEQRQNALARLAEQARAHVHEAFGNEKEAAATYLEQNMRWLASLEKGDPLETRPDGTIISLNPKESTQ